MGLYDTIVVLDEVPSLSCPDGHAARSFQTKDLEYPSMSTYLIHGGRLYRAVNGDETHDDDAAGWRIEGPNAIREHRYELREVHVRRPLRVYTHCRECAPLLVRSDRPTLFGDLVNEHALFVDFSITFRSGEPLQVERTSGSREQLKQVLRSGGAYVLAEDEPLAIAHREIRKARERVRGD